jgi:poly(3-hydroxybutyrate) depolymerase
MITLDQLPAGHPGRAFLTGSTTWFAVQADPRFSYGLRIPDGFAPGAAHPLVVAVHGTTRQAQQLRDAWTPFAERHHAVIVTPLFPAGITGADDVDGYKAMEDHGIRYDQILFDLLGEVATRWSLDVARFYLAGHSGGGQYTNRMLLLHPGRLAGAVISAPGRITLIDPDQPWPRGTADTRARFGIDIDRAAIAAVPTLLTAGERDEGRAALHAQHDASQAGYGATRVARLETLAGNLRAHSADIRLELAADAGHQGNPTLSIAQRFLGGLIEGARS